MYVIPKPAPL